jgi:cyclase
VDARWLLASGADIIVLRSAAAARPDLVGEIAAFFGDQCVVIAMDLHRAGGGPPTVRPTPGSVMPGDPLEAMAAMASAGAGEILAQVTDDDGRGGGIDVSYLHDGAAIPALPLIVASGTGHPRHVAAALRTPGVAAVAIANILSHSEQSVTTLKSWLRSNGIDIRLDTAHDYLGGDFDSRGRPLPVRQAGGR